MNLLRIIQVILCFLSVNAAISFAAEPDVCALLKKEKKYIPYSKENRPVMYLVTKNGEITQGPVNFGTYAYKPLPTAIISTEYRLLIFPKRVKALYSGRGTSATAILDEVKSMCPNSNLYKISYQGLFPYKSEQSITSFRRELPKSFEDKFYTNDLEDTGLDEGDKSVEPICRFDCRFVGTIVDGSKK